jgi:hypothetical protein
VAFGRLKIVDFEAENDEGDLADMARGILKHFQLYESRPKSDSRKLFPLRFARNRRRKVFGYSPKKCVNTKLICFGSMLSKIIWAGTFARRKPSGDCAAVSQAQEEAQTAEAPLVHG